MQGILSRSIIPAFNILKLRTRRRTAKQLAYLPNLLLLSPCHSAARKVSVLLSAAFTHSDACKVVSLVNRKGELTFSQGLSSIAPNRMVLYHMYCEGPCLNDVYTEEGRGLPECIRSEGSCVDMQVLWIWPECRQGGRGSKIPNIV